MRRWLLDELSKKPKFSFTSEEYRSNVFSVTCKCCHQYKKVATFTVTLQLQLIRATIF